jgi:copper resistance protein B
MTRVRRAALVMVGAAALNASTALAQHAAHEHETQASEQKPALPGAQDHSEHQQPAREQPPFVPPITDEDREAAFPQDLGGHAVHDRSLNYFVLFDQLEWQSVAEGTGLDVDAKGWVGGDRDRFSFRAEGDAADGRVGEAEAHLFYARLVARWWEIVAGVRQDFRPGPSRTSAAIGIQGLAPYWFEVELTGYVGSSGRTHLRGEVEYELLLTNRLILQPLFEIQLSGKSDPERGMGAGLNTTDLGVRLRYEFLRELAPYVGVAWNRKWGRTGDLAEAAGEETGGARFVTGMRVWF